MQSAVTLSPPHLVTLSRFALVGSEVFAIVRSPLSGKSKVLDALPADEPPGLSQRPSNEPPGLSRRPSNEPPGLSRRDAGRLKRDVRLALALVALGWAAIFVIAWLLKPDPRGLGTHEQLGLPPCPFS